MPPHRLILDTPCVFLGVPDIASYLPNNKLNNPISLSIRPLHYLFTITLMSSLQFTDKETPSKSTNRFTLSIITHVHAPYIQIYAPIVYLFFYHHDNGIFHGHRDNQYTVGG